MLLFVFGRSPGTVTAGPTSLPCTTAVGGPSVWTPRAPIPSGVEGSTGVIIGSKIYVTHGFIPGDSTITQIYDIPSNSWDPPGANAAVARSELAGVCAIENGVPKVFAIGGRDNSSACIGGSPCADVEVYDPGTNIWAARAAMPTARRALCATYVPTLGAQGTIFAIGGGTGGTVPHSGTASGANEAYDVAGGAWAPKAAMPTPMMGVYACVYHPGTGLIYVFGGYNSATGAVSNLVQRYDPAADTWLANGMPLPTARSNAVAGICAGSIYVIGGLNPSVFDNRTEVQTYNPIANVWFPAPPLPTARSEMASTAISTGLDIYVIGTGAFGVAGSPHDRFQCEMVGGLSVDLDPYAARTPLDAQGSSGSNAGLLAGVIAAATAGVIAMTGAAWYARRRVK